MAGASRANSAGLKRNKNGGCASVSTLPSERTKGKQLIDWRRATRDRDPSYPGIILNISPVELGESILHDLQRLPIRGAAVNRQSSWVNVIAAQLVQKHTVFEDAV